MTGGGGTRAQGRCGRHCEREPGPWPALYSPHMARRGEARGSRLKCTPCPSHTPRGPSSRGHMHPILPFYKSLLCEDPPRPSQGALCRCPRVPGPQSPLPTPHPEPTALESLSRCLSLTSPPPPRPCPDPPGAPWRNFRQLLIPSHFSDGLTSSLKGAQNHHPIPGSNPNTPVCPQHPVHPGCKGWWPRGRTGPMGGAENADSPEALGPDGKCKIKTRTSHCSLFSFLFLEDFF